MKARFPYGLWLTAISLFLLVFAGTALAHWHHHPRHHAPELDPTLIGSGLAVLGGSVLLLLERYRRRR